MFARSTCVTPARSVTIDVPVKCSFPCSTPCVDSPRPRMSVAFCVFSSKRTDSAYSTVSPLRFFTNVLPVMSM